MKSAPLRIIPGSHMKALALTEEERKQPHPDEVIVYPKSGDVAVFHNAIVHSGTASPLFKGLVAPRSLSIIRTQTRSILSALQNDRLLDFFEMMNHSWLKHRANYSGPISEAVKARARATGNRRLLRLLGEDANVFRRANSGFMQPDEERWEEWIAEDAADLKS